MLVKEQKSDTVGEHVALINIVGWGGALSRDVIGIVLDVLTVNGIIPIAVGGLGGRLGIVLTNENGKSGLQVIHNVCREHCFIE